MDEAVFDLKNVSYSYLGKINALKEISFKVLPGEQICIMGANGSGKSTLLGIMDALVFPTSGEFRAFGNLVKEEIFDSIKDNDFAAISARRWALSSRTQMCSSSALQCSKSWPSGHCSLISPRRRSGLVWKRRWR